VFGPLIFDTLLFFKVMGAGERESKRESWKVNDKVLRAFFLIP
jgi:hypothetical protein